MLKFSLFQNGNKIVSNEEGRDQKWSSCLIFKLQVGGPNRPIQVKALNFHTQSVHSLTLQLLPIGKNYNNIANFFCAFFRSETFLLSISIAFAASRPSSNYVLFSSKEKVFEKLWIAWWKRFPLCCFIYHLLHTKIYDFWWHESRVISHAYFLLHLVYTYVTMIKLSPPVYFS